MPSHIAPVVTVARVEKGVQRPLLGNKLAGSMTLYQAREAAERVTAKLMIADFSLSGSR